MNRVHVVKEGDCLSCLDQENWKKIYEMNKDVIGTNPDLIFPGQALKISDDIEIPQIKIIDSEYVASMPEVGPNDCTYMVDLQQSIGCESLFLEDHKNRMCIAHNNDVENSKINNDKSKTHSQHKTSVDVLFNFAYHGNVKAKKAVVPNLASRDLSTEELKRAARHKNSDVRMIVVNR